MDDFERELSEMLHGEAAGLPDTYDAPPELFARTRRRRIRKLGALSVAALVVVLGSAAAVAQVVERDSARDVISTRPAPTTSTTAAHEKPRAVPTVACYISSPTSRLWTMPPTAPKVPLAGDPTKFSNLQYFVAADSPQYSVLGQRKWSCRVVADINSATLQLYDQRAYALSGKLVASIAINTHVLGRAEAGYDLACLVFDDPAIVQHLAKFAGQLQCPQRGRTVTRVSEHVATFIDTDGARGAGWIVLPSSDTADDGQISVLTCRPTAKVTAAGCDTIVADFAARNDAAPLPDPTQPKEIVAAPYTAGSWIASYTVGSWVATSGGVAIAQEGGRGIAAYDVATRRWSTFGGPPFEGDYSLIAARGDSVFARVNPNSLSAPTTAFAALDVTTGEWRLLAPVPADVPFLSTTGDADHIYGVGSFEDMPEASVPGTIAVEYDIGADRWTQLPKSPLGARAAFTVEWTGTELLVWSGGSNHQGDIPAYTDGAAYNPATGSWRSLPTAPVPARYLAAHVWTGTEMLVWGGTQCGCPQPVADGGGAAYNPATNQWRTLPPAPLRGVRAPAAVWTGREMFAFRGGVAGEVAGAVYNPSTDSWRHLPASARAEGDAVIAAFVNRQVLIGLAPDGPFTGIVYPADP